MNEKLERKNNKKPSTSSKISKIVIWTMVISMVGSVLLSLLSVLPAIL